MTGEEQEFSRKIPLARVKEGGQVEDIIATPGEAAAVAARLGLPAITKLTAYMSLEPWKRGGIRVRGMLQADLDQVCVVTLDRFATRLNEEIERLYVLDGKPGTEASATSFDPFEEDEPDVIQGGEVDLGELMIETLALSLDPYPKKPGARFEEHAQQPAGRQNPFAVLESLKKPSG